MMSIKLNAWQRLQLATRVAMAETPRVAMAKTPRMAMAKNPCVAMSWRGNLFSTRGNGQSHVVFLL